MSENELELDLSKIGLSKGKIVHFFKKYLVVFLILIALIMSIYIRMIPSDLPITDNWAKSTVNSYYKNSIKTQLKQQYPNLPDENLASMVDKQFADYSAQNKATIEAQTKELSQEYKSQFQDENGYPYMPDIDPYTWLRYARNYLDHGYMGDEIRNGTQWDNHMTAPIGNPSSTRPHAILLAYLYKLNKIINSKTTLMQSANYFPVIFAALSVIPIFFIGQMMAGNVGGLFAALMMGVNGAFLGRTSFGHADTDAYAMFFAAYFIWFFFLSLKSNNIKKTAIYAALAGLTIGLFSIFWGGWWYVSDFVVGTIGLYFIYLLFETKKYSWHELKQNQHMKQFVIASLLVVLASGIFISYFVSPSSFVNSVLQPIQFSKIKEASHASLWPNVYTTVAELNNASFNSVIEAIGGKMFFYISLLGTLLLILIKKEERRVNLPYALLIILWYIGIIYASMKGIRFSMMLVIPLALGFGAALGILYKKIIKYMEKMNVSPKITGIVLFIFFVLIMFPYVKGEVREIGYDIPMINDAWYNALTKIKLESQPNAIINSWWDFGHHFKYFADRAVTFDGATQNSPMAHWIGKVLYTSNEKEAIGILRMLDCGSNNAFEELNKVINDTSESVKILDNVVVLDQSGAENYLLSKGLNNKVVQKVLKNTHCVPPEDYFITSEDMVGKSAVWAHFGSWNFDKADIWTETKNLPKEDAIKKIQTQLGVSEENAKKVYFEVKGITDENAANNWIAPWPGYGSEQNCVKQNNNIICGGVIIDLATKETKINTDQGLQYPHSIVYVENNNFIEKHFEEVVPQSLLLIKNGDSYKIIIASADITSSVFTKLFYYDGAGLEHFTKFTEEMQPTNEKLIVWKVKW